MSFSQFKEKDPAVELLQRSLARGRLGHAYLFSGDDLGHLEVVARTLAKTLNCERRGTNGVTDCCDQCAACRKIDSSTHADVRWIRPESKSRIITTDQMRDLMQTIFLKPTEAEYKVSIIVGADRLNTNAANAFLKTLEEPPPRSVLILLSTAPGKILETILSRCLRLTFAGESGRFRDETFLAWLKHFSETAVAERGSLLSRYRLLSVLLKRLNELKETIVTDLEAKSPLEKYDDIDPKLREKWEDELAAAIEAEYRRQRADVLTGLQFWLRDVWLSALAGTQTATFPALQPTAAALASRIDAPAAVGNLRVMERLQRQLNSNVQEALALEVGLLQLKLG
ncbi:MAG TPA: DNA polymerase III subunit [Candidatus Limnocylindria bacterium]|nr:DNA polymerase III subunit [Candidatus Limnocylindria bacterium]